LSKLIKFKGANVIVRTMIVITVIVRGHEVILIVWMSVRHSAEKGFREG